MKSREEFIQNNIGLVHACAKRFKGKGIEYDDLFQAGCIGLCKAADNFEEERGLRFSTYAVPVILGEMKRLFREGGTVKVGRSLKELSLRAARESEKFLSEEGRAPQINELSEILGVDPEQAALALCASMPVISLTNGGDDDNELKQGDIPVSAPEENISEKLALRQVLDKLPSSDKNLIILRYFKHKTQTDTALMLGMSQVQVSRKEKKILAFMRSELI